MLSQHRDDPEDRNMMDSYSVARFRKKNMFVDGRYHQLFRRCNFYSWRAQSHGTTIYVFKLCWINISSKLLRVRLNLNYDDIYTSRIHFYGWYQRRCAYLLRFIFGYEHDLKEERQARKTKKQSESKYYNQISMRFSSHKKKIHVVNDLRTIRSKLRRRDLSQYVKGCPSRFQFSTDMNIKSWNAFDRIVKSWLLTRTSDVLQIRFDYIQWDTTTLWRKYITLNN